ncbi:hypothetical protein RRG08_058427 [Elysia crispata]|uniref:Uncharacterized protein n=1 Tax=Elysia crispata TaxID=231223 RepID=A0AAE1BB91_9GAST|nr:hypothetical protein RRG08_058427 [Elysia crispata]
MRMQQNKVKFLTVINPALRQAFRYSWPIGRDTRHENAAEQSNVPHSDKSCYMAGASGTPGQSAGIHFMKMQQNRVTFLTVINSALRRRFRYSRPIGRDTRHENDSRTK